LTKQKPDFRFRHATVIRPFGSISATRLSRWDPWLSVPQLLVVWLCRSFFMNNLL